MPVWVFTLSKMEIPTKGCLKMEERMAVEPLLIPMAKNILVNIKKEKEQGRVFIHSKEVKPIKALFGMGRKMAKVLLHIQMVIPMMVSGKMI